jgi:tetratricopeptide (TPR) repeat protein
MRRISALAILLILSLPTAAWAEEKDNQSAAAPTVQRKSPAELRADELDRLFAQLHAENAAERAPGVEQKIWANWGRNDSVTAELLLGQATRAMNDEEYQTAEDILDKLVDVQPGYAEAWNRRATLHFIARRYDKSRADIAKVLELEPRHFGALAGLGMILEAQGKFDEALAAYREAISINPYMQAVQEKVKLLEKQRPDI